jgi:GNAT superfamily N-acetyltransferase
VAAESHVRPATPDDDAVIGRLAAEGDATADAPYLALIRSQHGRLLVADAGGEVVAFGGVVDIDDVSMLTDLFVAAAHRGRGHGARLLQALFADRPRRMTFSSVHPAAHAAYASAGMEARWRLLYLEGEATGGGVLPPEGPWQHERSGLVDEWRRAGARVSADLVLMREGDGHRLARLQHEQPVPLVDRVLAGLDHGSRVSMCVPEGSELARWAQTHGFRVTDHDTFRATPGVELPADLHVLDPGLA